MEAYIFDAIRTPRGLAKETGALRSLPPIELLKTLYQALFRRNPIDSALIEDVILGCVTQVNEQGANLAKISSLYAGLSQQISGVTLNRFCASGLDAIIYAAAKIHSQLEQLVIAGGVESMSRVPMLSDQGAWFFDKKVAKETRFIHMGVSADLIATLEAFTREELDQYAVNSHQRALSATRAGHFQRSIIPVYSEAGALLLDKDENIREGLSLEKLSRFAPLFGEVGAAGQDALVLSQYSQLAQINHLHHAANAPAMVDGASMLLIGSLSMGARLGLRPRAKIVSFANTCVEPMIMLTATAPALQKALRLADKTIKDLDLVECNESFSATVLSFIKHAGLDAARVNVNGGAIAMGHPLGATGGALTSTLLDELERRDQRLGAVVICAGAGIGQAMIIERL